MWPQEAKFKERRKGAVGVCGFFFFFFWTSPIPHWPSPPMVHLGCPGTSLVPSRILPDVHQGLQWSSCPSRTTGHWVGGWGKQRSFALLYFWPKCELLHCFVAGLPNNVGQCHPYRVKMEDRDICLDNCSCQFSVLTENFSVNEKKPFYTERCPW